MSVKDLASDMLGEMVGQPESEDVLQTTNHGEVANLAPMQGLKVMAKVAGNASPQVTRPVKLNDLVDGSVDVVVPVIKPVQTAMSLASVYAFKGTSEIGCGRLITKQKEASSIHIVKAFLTLASWSSPCFISTIGSPGSNFRTQFSIQMVARNMFGIFETFF